MHDPAMAALFMSLLGALRSTFRTRAELAPENLALRQQLANLRHTSSGRPRIRMADRAFWLVLSRLWSRWANVLVIVKPHTVVRWHRDHNAKARALSGNARPLGQDDGLARTGSRRLERPLFA
jgi:hypothetical protein